MKPRLSSEGTSRIEESQECVPAFREEHQEVRQREKSRFRPCRSKERANQATEEDPLDSNCYGLPTKDQYDNGDRDDDDTYDDRTIEPEKEQETKVARAKDNLKETKESQ